MGGGEPAIKSRGGTVSLVQRRGEDSTGCIHRDETEIMKRRRREEDGGGRASFSVSRHTLTTEE